MPFGAPAASAASLIILAVSITHFFARGCGEITTALRVLRQSNTLKITVDVGFVVGITAATTPTGSAILIVPKDSSLSTTPQVFVSLYAL